VREQLTKSYRSFVDIKAGLLSREIVVAVKEVGVFLGGRIQRDKGHRRDFQVSRDYHNIVQNHRFEINPRAHTSYDLDLHYRLQNHLVKQP
jgi:hypothetical protein